MICIMGNLTEMAVLLSILLLALRIHGNHGQLAHTTTITKNTIRHRMIFEKRIWQCMSGTYSSLHNPVPWPLCSSAQKKKKRTPKNSIQFQSFVIKRRNTTTLNFIDLACTSNSFMDFVNYNKCCLIVFSLWLSCLLKAFSRQHVIFVCLL